MSTDGVLRMIFKSFQRGLDKPVVYRLAGYEMKEAKQHYEESKHKYPLLHLYQDMDEAIAKTIELAI